VGVLGIATRNLGVLVCVCMLICVLAMLLGF
jgi:hypothetical protein